MFKFIVLSSIVLALCIDPVFLLGTVTVTTTSLAYTTVTESLVTQSLCISSGTDPCRRKRGMLYENPFLTFDDGTGQAPQYIFNGFR